MILALTRFRECFFVLLKRLLHITDSSFAGCRVAIFVTDFPYVGINKELFYGIIESYTHLQKRLDKTGSCKFSNEKLLVAVDEDIFLHDTRILKIILTPRHVGYPLLRILLPWPWNSVVCNGFTQSTDGEQVQWRPTFIAGIRMIKKMNGK